MKLSTEFLQLNDEARVSIEKVAKRIKSAVKIKLPLAGNLSSEYLRTTIEEEFQINLDEVRNSFLAQGNNLFDFVMSYNFEKELSFDDKDSINEEKLLRLIYVTHQHKRSLDQEIFVKGN